MRIELRQIGDYAPTLVLVDEDRIHLSLRAVEWLTKATTSYGTSHVYTLPPGIIACPTPCPNLQLVGTICGVEDVRAMYMKSKLAVYFRSKRDTATGNWFKKALVKLPTCPTCAVILDWAMEIAPEKSNKYITKEDLGFYDPHKFN